MKIKKHISKILLFGMLANNFSVLSSAGTLSPDTRYETFEGNNIAIPDVLEEDKIDVEIEGDTLVNLASNYFNREPYIRNSDGTVNITRWDTSLHGHYSLNKVETLKRNTTYTLFLNKTLRVIIRDNYMDSDGTIDLCNSRVLTDKVVFKTSNDTNTYTYIKLLDNLEEEISTYPVNNVEILLLEGDWTNKEAPDHFEGIKSAGQDDESGHKVDVSIKKEIEIETESGNIDPNSGENIPHATRIRAKDYTPVKPSTEYKLTRTILAGNMGVRYYDENKNFIPGIEYVMSDTYIFKTPSNCKYLRFVDESGDLNSIHKLTLSKGSDDKREIILNEPLRGLSNGIKDRIIKINGQWFIERNCAEILLNGTANEHWSRRSDSFPSDKTQLFCFDIEGANAVKNTNVMYCDRFIPRGGTGESQRDWECIFLATNGDGVGIYLRIDNSKLDALTGNGLKKWLSNNPIKVVYQLATPIYEPLNTDLTINLYKDITHISNNSSIPVSMKIIVDRVANRAKEFSRIAKLNPTIDNLSQARYWINLMNESALKDEFQNEIDAITNIDDLQLEKKTATANIDLYIKSENTLTMSLSTNSIMFDNFGGTEDMEKLGCLDIQISSSLPYDLNAYLVDELYNSDKSKIMDKEILNIKESSQSSYNLFTGINNKLTLKANNSAGNFINHSIDLRLRGGITHDKDVYKTVIKFEAEQK